MSLASLRGALVPVALLLLWEILSRTGAVSPVVLPPPSAVAVKWWAGLQPALPYDPAQESYLSWLFSGEMPHDAVSSLGRVLAGFALGAGLAVPVGLMLGTSDGLYGLFNPLLQVLRPIPPIAYIPLAIVAVSDGLGYRILEAREYMWSDKIIGGMLTIGILGLIIDGAMSRLNDHLLRWHRGLER